MASRIEYSGDKTRQKQPRREDKGYLDFVRERSCVISGRRPVEAAHLRTAYRLLVKREAGVAAKPSDFWCLPLAPDLHREQHRIGDELAFWRSHNIDNPFQLCLALFASYNLGDEEWAEQIIAEYRLMAMQII